MQIKKKSFSQINTDGPHSFQEYVQFTQWKAISAVVKMVVLITAVTGLVWWLRNDLIEANVYLKESAKFAFVILIISLSALILADFSRDLVRAKENLFQQEEDEEEARRKAAK